MLDRCSIRLPANKKVLVVLCLMCLTQPVQSVAPAPGDPTHGGAEDYRYVPKPDVPWKNEKKHVTALVVSRDMVSDGLPPSCGYCFVHDRQVAYGKAKSAMA
jgi:hypothetical protein